MDIETTVKHKFLENSNMTFQEVFDFAYKKLVPVLQGLAKELREDRFLEPLKKVSFECALKAGQDRARQLPSNDFAAFINPGGEPSHFGKHVLTRETVEDTTQAFELKVTECLWAKTFREMRAADIGYLLLCNTDYADCQGFNPKITLIRSKTLMQGDDCCNHRFVWEE
jgi:hypothetical protein